MWVNGRQWHVHLYLLHWTPHYLGYLEKCCLCPWNQNINVSSAKRFSGNLSKHSVDIASVCSVSNNSPGTQGNPLPLALHLLPPSPWTFPIPLIYHCTVARWKNIPHFAWCWSTLLPLNPKGSPSVWIYYLHLPLWICPRIFSIFGELYLGVSHLAIVFFGQLYSDFILLGQQFFMIQLMLKQVFMCLKGKKRK